MDMDMDVDMEDEPQMKIVKNYQRPDVRWGGWMSSVAALSYCPGGGGGGGGGKKPPPAESQAKEAALVSESLCCLCVMPVGTLSGYDLTCLRLFSGFAVALWGYDPL